ncbi:hypothetical protein R1flu_013720 [Riccia fluitans]|uniref:NB-ARC domain-containing protein n=1 Tax=Riccia fluitans TaxID=41844 RepID=A0ABD1YHK3_9MARC
MYDLKSIQGSSAQIRANVGAKICRYGQPIQSSGEGVWHEIRGKTLLLVFDDIDENRHVDLLEEIAEENDREAELFMTHAFPGEKEPPFDLQHSVEKVVKGCAGLPLTLEVTGRYLKGKRSVELWDEIAEALKNADNICPVEEGVWAKLRLSYDSLRNEEKEMFLDVACLLLHEDSRFTLKEMRSSWDSLHGVVRMHEHLRALGVKIAKEVGRWYIAGSLQALTRKETSNQLKNIIALRIDPFSEDAGGRTTNAAPRTKDVGCSKDQRRCSGLCSNI